MEREYYEEFLPENIEERPIRRRKKTEIEIGSKVRLKGIYKISMVSSFGLFGSNDLTGAVINEQHKFPMKEFIAEDGFEVGKYVSNDNVYEVIDFSKTGNAVKIKMGDKEVLIFKKCFDIVE